jgi:excisionase family DNA binding protein
MEYERRTHRKPGNVEIKPSAVIDFGLLSVKQAAGILNIGTQAVRAAISNGRLKAKNINGKIRLSPKDVKDYENIRWNRDYRYDDDEISIKNAAKVLNVPEQRLYYLIRRGDIKIHYKQKKIIAIKKKDLIETFGS